MAIISYPLNIARHIVETVECLHNAGYETYVVGGAVRDFLLNRIPKDYDISTAATPEDIRRVFGRRRARIIGRRFRLVHLHFGKEIVEISTFRRIPDRKDQEAKIKQKLSDVPENMIFSDNEFGTAREDAERRDFTINALFYDPIAQELVDFTGMGIADVRNRTVRAIGDPEVRFEEDPVRILRALKFAGQCGMTLEPETEQALRKTMPLINLAAPSRLTLEFEKIMKNSASHEIFRIFRDYGFLAYFLPELDRQWDQPSGQEAMALLRERNRRVTDGRYRDSVSLAMALLLLPQVEKKFGRLEPGVNWVASSREFFIDEVLRLLKEFYTPHNPIKALAFSAQRLLMLLPEMWKPEKLAKNLEHPGYQHAREIMLILNGVRWHRDDLETLFPVGDSLPQPPHKLHHGNRRRNRRALMPADNRPPAV